MRWLWAGVMAGAFCAAAVAEERVTPPPARAEVVAFVNRAADFARERGREKALTEFARRDGPFCKGELYIYAYDMKGVCLAHPVMPERVGRDASQEKDSHGVAIHQECLKLFARAESGWIACTWFNPSTKRLEPKALYVRKMPPDWYIGSGTYGKEAENQP